ncbi:MAG TPA: hypothetical protein VFE53_15240 [Mucilaginibacter sp.]|jgi:hypothetical protein|nr:hypothetical protein [Mucilaginibacter sp.]
MNTLRYRIFANWNFMRFLRLALGIWISVMAVQSRDWSVGLISGLFIFMALTNTGCCGAYGCAIPNSKQVNDEGPIEVKHEGIQEIK